MPRMVVLSIEPGAQSIGVGDRLRLALVVRYDDGSVRDLTQSATWQSFGAAVRATGRPGAHRRPCPREGANHRDREWPAGDDDRSNRGAIDGPAPGEPRKSPVLHRRIRACPLSRRRTHLGEPRRQRHDLPAAEIRLRAVSRLPSSPRLTRLPIMGVGAGDEERRAQRRLLLFPLMYRRTGPGKGLDGKPRFDLTQLNPTYFRRLRRRVIAARERGIYVIVMLFDGWSVERKGNGDNPWDGHPFNGENNVNGIDGDRNKDGSGEETHTLANPLVTRFQEKYVAMVVRSVSDQPNVLYEISNESSNGSLRWQNHMVGFIRSQESTSRRHPVGITSEYPDGNNAELIASSADWISPNGDIEDLRPSSGVKVILADTDHLCGVCGDARFPWQAFTRGLNPMFMDVYDGKAVGLGATGRDPHDPQWEVIRRRLGVTVALSERIDMGLLVPRGDLCSTGYCLADPKRGHLYVVYLPEGRTVTVDVTASGSRLRAEWVDPDTGVATRGETIQGGGRRSISAPGHGDVVLVLRSVS